MSKITSSLSPTAWKMPSKISKGAWAFTGDGTSMIFIWKPIRLCRSSMSFRKAGLSPPPAQCLAFASGVNIKVSLEGWRGAAAEQIDDSTLDELAGGCGIIRLEVVVAF